MLFRVAWKSLVNRKFTVLLTALSIATSVLLLCGVDHVRIQAREGFSKTISGVDLIVGARTGQINLLLYSVFHTGNATSNISWSSYLDIAGNRLVEWAIPVSLGDSHKGYRVMGTSTGFFSHYRYGEDRKLLFSQGRQFEQLYDVVLGSEVASKLGYSIGDRLVLSHGTGSVSFTGHDNNPFTVSGILLPTGTPVDQTLHTSIEGIEAIHAGWNGGNTHIGVGPETSRDLTPTTLTAFLVRLKSRVATFQIQRLINEYNEEPLLAILPGVALTELWQMVGAVEKVLLLISGVVLITSLLGLTSMLLATLNERQREIAVLRAIGAHPLFVFLLIEIEVLIVSLFAITAGLAMLWSGLILAQDTLTERFGLLLSPNIFTTNTALYSSAMVIAALLLGAIPAINAYKNSLGNALKMSS